MSDLISRQDAIDALREYNANMLRHFEVCYGVEKHRVDDCIELLEQLPSAQPEIIRCKDCKHRDPEDKKCDCGHDILWQLPRPDDWFCGDGEK